MKVTKYLTVWGAVSALTFAVFAASALAGQDDKDTSSKKWSRTTTSTQNDQSFGTIERANKLIGKEVFSSDNQKLGKLDNLIVDLESGHVLYAIVGSGGIGAIGEKKFAIAPGAFTEYQGGKDLHLNVDKAKFNGAPQFTKDIDKADAMNKADFVNQVYQYFGQNAWWQGAPAANGGDFH